jgi:cytochrome P450
MITDMACLYYPTVYVGLSLICLGVYLTYRLALPKPIHGIPHHKGSANHILGDALGMIRHARQHGTVFDWMANQATELNSPIFQLFLKPFSMPAVFVTDPREAQDVLLRRTKEFDRAQFFRDVFGGTVPHCHVIQPTNDKFRQGRRLLADTMGKPFLHRVAAPLVYRRCQSLMELWRLKNRLAAGHAFWAADDLSQFALDSIWDVAFGSQLDCLGETMAHIKSLDELGTLPPPNRDDPIVFPNARHNAAISAMEILTHGLDVAVTSPVPSLAHWLLRLTPSYRSARAYKERLVQDRLSDAKVRLLGEDTKSEATDDLQDITCATDHMVRRESQAAKKENREPDYESRQAKDELFGFLVGGYDTSATTMMWSIKLLADNPRVQKKLRAVLLNTFGEAGGGMNTPDQTTATRIPYLDAVVEEVIRCAQTASSATRMTTCDVQLLGHHIPKGVDVYFLSNGPGYILPNDLNERIAESTRSGSSQDNKHRVIPTWDSSDIGVFKPERWIKIDADGNETFDKYAGTSMQFGAGLRGCFGKNLANLEIRILIAVLIWTFELQSVPERLRGHEAFDSLTHKPKKCYLRLREVERE